MLLSNEMNPSSVTNVEWKQIRNLANLKSPCPDIIKEYNLHMNELAIYEQWKTSYELDWKLMCRYYFYFPLMDLVVVNTQLFIWTNLSWTYERSYNNHGFTRTNYGWYIVSNNVSFDPNFVLFHSFFILP